jgi:hypothetical protein
MQDKTTILATTSAGVGFKINNRKTEFMNMNTTSITPITVGNQRSVVDKQGGIYRDVTVRIGKAAKDNPCHAYGHLGITGNANINKDNNSNVKPVLL